MASARSAVGHPQDTSTHLTKMFPLLSLPAEILNDIIKYAVIMNTNIAIGRFRIANSVPEEFYISVRDKSQTRGFVGLSRSCKTLHGLSQRYFYQYNCFSTISIMTMNVFLSGFGSTNTTLIRNITIQSGMDDEGSFACLAKNLESCTRIENLLLLMIADGHEWSLRDKAASRRTQRFVHGLRQLKLPSRLRSCLTLKLTSEDGTENDYMREKARQIKARIQS